MGITYVASSAEYTFMSTQELLKLKEKAAERDILLWVIRKTIEANPTLHFPLLEAAIDEGEPQSVAADYGEFYEQTYTT